MLLYETCFVYLHGAGFYNNLYKVMKRIILFYCLVAIWSGGCKQKVPTPIIPPENLNFIVASDMGRRGISQQKNIANRMGRCAEQNKIDFVAVAGDPIHDDGVQSVSDEEWQLKFENIYTAQSLHNIPFYIISGNHEYRGNVQAILDYSAISERWNAPARYYSMEQIIDENGQKALLVFIDTTPLIDKYCRKDNYSDARKQSMERQLYWIDSTLMASNDRWKIVIGHHPVYADTKKEESERADMQERVGKMLENHGVDFYICGHIHNFQYIQPKGTTVNYIVNSSASKSRKVKPIEGTVFCNGDPGYSLFSVSADSIQFFFINHTGEAIYRHTIVKQ